MKVFIGPKEIAGYYRNLSKGFAELGINYDYITFESHPFGYSGETKFPILLRLAKFLKKYHGNFKRSLFILSRLMYHLSELCSNIWVYYTIIRYDVFIFGFGSSLKPDLSDLATLKALNKTVISVIGHGSEARPPYINGFYQSPDDTELLKYEKLKKYTEDIKSRLKIIEQYSTYVVGSPFSTSQLAENKFINWFALGVPCADLNNHEESKSNFKPKTNIKNKTNIRVLHSPSNPIGKGTAVISKSIKRLRNKGYQIELVLIQGQPNSVVLNEIQKSDFVIDQVYSDTPLAGFATEAAFFGKASIVGGYAYPHYKAYIPQDMLPPSKTCYPDELEKAIEELVINREERLKIGRDSQNFVKDKWNAKAVASRFLRLINNDIPEEWWIEPRSVFYIEGVGQTLEQTKQNIQDMVDLYGKESLMLHHRPELEKKFLELADLEK